MMKLLIALVLAYLAAPQTPPTSLRLQLVLTNPELTDISGLYAPDIAWAMPLYAQQLVAHGMSLEAFGMGFPDAGSQFDAFAEGGPWVHFPLPAPEGSVWWLSGGPVPFIPEEQWGDEYRRSNELWDMVDHSEDEPLRVYSNEWVQAYIYDELGMERP